MNNKFLEYLLKEEPEKVMSKAGYTFRKMIHPALMLGVGASKKCKLHIVRKELYPKGKQLIFVANHGFKDDIACILQSLGRLAYMFFGSLALFFHSTDGIAVWLNGTILVNRTDKSSRKASFEKMKKYMDMGGDLLIFPEAVWNCTPNKLMLKLFPGVYKIADYSKAWIVPIATHLDGKDAYIIIGKAFDITKYSQEEGLQVLRDEIATLRYELMETFSKVNRNDLLKGKTPAEYWDNKIEELIDQVSFYDRETEDKCHFIDKSEVDYLEAFDHLNNLIPSKENAFLFRNPINKATYGRQTGYRKKQKQ